MTIQDFIKEEFEKAGIEIPNKEAIDSLIATIEASFLKISEVIESFVDFVRQNLANCFDSLKQAMDEAYVKCIKLDKRRNEFAYKKNDIRSENKKCLLKQVKYLNLYRFNKHLIRHKLIC